MTSSDDLDAQQLLAQYLLSSSADEVTKWLIERLDSRDTILRQDRKSDEDPEAILVTFLQRRGIADPASVKLVNGILELLRQVDEVPPLIQPYHFIALRVCQQVYMPRTAAWFQKHLRKAARKGKTSLAELDEMILRGAVVQASGAQNPRLRQVWLKLLDQKRASTIALNGLARTWLQQASYLERWWHAEGAATRERELRYLLAAACREITAADVLSSCRDRASTWSQDLKDAVDRSLSLLGHPRPFRSQTCAVRNAMDGAARRRELVLEDTA